MAVEKTLAIVIVDSSLVLWGIENGLAWVRGLKRKRGGGGGGGGGNCKDGPRFESASALLSLQKCGL